MRKAFIACGGTGGHLSPGIALAEELTARDWSCLLLVSKKEVDSRLLQKYPQFAYEALAGSAFALSPIRFARSAVNLIRGTAACVRRIKEHQPDVIVGFGGFLSMPALLAGYLCGVPVAIHEANRVAGRVTRIVSFFADRIYLPKGVALRGARASRIRFLGMPVRREIRSLPKAKAKSQLGLNPDQKTLFVMGGSQGAEALNRWVDDNLESLAQREIQVYCLTGAGKAESSVTHRSPKGVEVKSIFKRFSDDMAVALSAADLIVSRAGAGSIAEIVRCRAPAILVPYPLAADDHQRSNARNFEMLGCGMAVEQAYLPKLVEEVKDLMYNEWMLQRFRSNLEGADRVDAQSQMARDLEDLASRRAPEPQTHEEGASSHG